MMLGNLMKLYVLVEHLFHTTSNQDLAKEAQRMMKVLSDEIAATSHAEGTGSGSLSDGSGSEELLPCRCGADSGEKNCTC